MLQQENKKKSRKHDMLVLLPGNDISLQDFYLIVFIISTQSERVVVSVEGGGGAGVSWLGTRAQWSREVETKIHSVADLRQELKSYTCLYRTNAAEGRLRANKDF